MSDSFFLNLFASMKPKDKMGKMGETLVDLTPKSYHDAIAYRKTKKKWIFFNGIVLAASVLGLALFYSAGLPTTVTLESEKSSQKVLKEQLKEYESVSIMEDEVKNSSLKLSLAGSSEIDWSRLIREVQAVLPSSTKVGSLGINVDTRLESEKSSAVYVVLNSDEPLGYSDTLRAFEAFEGVSNIKIGSLTSSGPGVYTYTITFDRNNEVKTNRFPKVVN